MASQSSSRSKPWYTPALFMVGVMLLYFIEQVLIFKAFARVGSFFSNGKILWLILKWPFLILSESVIYWVIRKRIRERKWVWTHLIFTLFDFVLLQLLYFSISVIFIYLYSPELYSAKVLFMQRIRFYCFWAGLITGHIFFVIAIVHSFSNKSSQQPADANDILSELPG